MIVPETYQNLMAVYFVIPIYIATTVLFDGRGNEMKMLHRLDNSRIFLHEEVQDRLSYDSRFQDTETALDLYLAEAQ